MLLSNLRATPAYNGDTLTSKPLHILKLSNEYTLHHIRHAKVREDTMSSQSTYVHSNNISSNHSGLLSIPEAISKRMPKGRKSASITRMFTHSLLAITALFSVASQAQMQPMETVTVIYRSSFDYALYQQTTEILTRFNRELPQQIIARARQDNVAMAKEFGFSVQEANELVSFDYHANQLQQNLIAQARLDNQRIAKQLGFFTNQSNELADQDKYSQKIGVLGFSE